MEFNYINVIQGLDALVDWTYSETESSTCTRFDKGEKSLWINSSGTYYGYTSPSIIKFLKENGAKNDN